MRQIKLSLPLHPSRPDIIQYILSPADGMTSLVEPTAKAFTPGEFVHSIVGKSVVVKLNSGVSYHGVLACLDGFMNLALEQCEEYVDGQRTKSFGDCFIRGNNGTLHVCLAVCGSVQKCHWCTLCSFLDQLTDLFSFCGLFPSLFLDQMLFAFFCRVP